MNSTYRAWQHANAQHAGMYRGYLVALSFGNVPLAHQYATVTRAWGARAAQLRDQYQAEQWQAFDRTTEDPRLTALRQRAQDAQTAQVQRPAQLARLMGWL